MATITESFEDGEGGPKRIRDEMAYEVMQTIIKDLRLRYQAVQRGIPRKQTEEEAIAQAAYEQVDALMTHDARARAKRI